MSLATTLTWGAVATLVAICFVLGAAPVFAVRLIARLYPKGHQRRAELVEEMKHVRGVGATLDQWRWLGESFAVGVCDGMPARLRELRQRQRQRQRVRSIILRLLIRLLEWRRAPSTRSWEQIKAEISKIEIAPQVSVEYVWKRRWGRWKKIRVPPTIVGRRRGEARRDGQQP